MTFNTSTDVWSFGVLMWELFSLIAMPYPDINAGLVRHLEEGFRLQRPMYATLGIYDIMLSCWRSLAARRPNFTQLTHELSKHIPVELKQVLFFVAVINLDRSQYSLFSFFKQFFGKTATLNTSNYCTHQADLFLIWLFLYILMHSFHTIPMADTISLFYYS